MGRPSLALARAFLAVSALGALSVGTTACGAASPRPESPAAGFAVLAIDGPPDGALLFVDDHPAGEWARTGGVFRVAPGTRHLRIEAAGFLTYRFETSLVAGETYDVSVELWPCFEGVDPGCQAQAP